jgi:hypothetical protein
LSFLLCFCIAALHSSFRSSPRLRSHRLRCDLFCHIALRKVYVALSVRTVWPAHAAAHAIFSLPSSSSRCSTCGSGHPFQRVSCLLITTIWLIDNDNSRKRGLIHTEVGRRIDRSSSLVWGLLA